MGSLSLQKNIVFATRVGWVTCVMFQFARMVAATRMGIVLSQRNACASLGGQERIASSVSPIQAVRMGAVISLGSAAVTRGGLAGSVIKHLENPGYHLFCLHLLEQTLFLKQQSRQTLDKLYNLVIGCILVSLFDLDTIGKYI